MELVILFCCPHGTGERISKGRGILRGCHPSMLSLPPPSLSLAIFQQCRSYESDSLCGLTVASFSDTATAALLVGGPAPLVFKVPNKTCHSHQHHLSILRIPSIFNLFTPFLLGVSPLLMSSNLI